MKRNIYDCYDNGKYIGTGTNGYWVETIGIPSSCVNSCAIYGYVYNKRYTFVINEERSNGNMSDWQREWMMEWDSVRNMFQKSI